MCQGEQSQVKRRLINSSWLITCSCFIQIHKLDSYPIKECKAGLSLNSTEPLGFLMIGAAQEQLKTINWHGTLRTLVLRKNNHLKPVKPHFCTHLLYTVHTMNMYCFVYHWYSSQDLVLWNIQAFWHHIVRMRAAFLEVLSCCMLNFTRDSAVPDTLHYHIKGKKIF